MDEYILAYAQVMLWNYFFAILSEERSIRLWNRTKRVSQKPPRKLKRNENHKNRAGVCLL